ncbi:MAG: DUF5615 family PIN-like protein [Deltaproteobacteria bacterium]|nr:DUF5615 family PIN-like protein [Deltaproteobacteria bacterium]
MNDQPLIFLADESCDFAFVRVLRQVGYDVTAIVEFMSGASDLKVLESAFEERRILLTEDKDFGEEESVVYFDHGIGSVNLVIHAILKKGIHF